MKSDTLLVHAGRHPEDHHGTINPPVYRCSTVLYETVQALEDSDHHRFDRMTYGRYGTPTIFALEEAIARLEGGFRSIATSSGLSAVTSALSAFVKAGHHVLVPDTVYTPTRRFCDTVLRGYGVETTYYDPEIGSAIEALIRPTTRVVMVESPGSLTFEIQDIPAIATAAHQHHGTVLIMDNTWATPLFFKPFAKGVDVSIHAATKYISGHSDVMLGLITTTEEYFATVKTHVTNWGFCAGSEEAWLGLRGLRTLSVRLRQHQENGILLANWLKHRSEVERVLHPALQDSPGHALWYRDFTGACGLFGVVLRPFRVEAVHAFLESLELFALGYSWGGYESLILPTSKGIIRTATHWQPAGPCLRIHAGLEAPDELIADLDRALSRLRSRA
ncbi:Cystathionine beta-lyase [invertebrate metagenome]|uniref:Cystathionine beta-lyase n=1 Tax=invertebrate metagenome TaxID=1711999 RepID=A0A484H5V9_9ZZZZ